MLVRLREGLGWRLRGLRRHVRAVQAFAWRRLLVRTTFVVVSGSVGKTTTKELLRAILSDYAPTVATQGNDNSTQFGGPTATLRRVRPWHRFAIIEAGIARRGEMRAVIRLLRPDLGVLLDIKRCHTNVFKTLDAIAEEKAGLIRALRKGSRAILNLDNPRIAALCRHAPCPVVGFGEAADSRVRLLEAQARWPERLTLRLAVDGKEHVLATRLVGTHWTNAVMAALATAMTCGVPVDRAVAAIAQVEPFWARMQPVTVPDSGAIVIRDEFNGSIDTFDAAFQVMEDADARRKVLVLSDYSDTSTKLRVRADRLGRRAAELGDLLVFVGEYAERSVKAAVAQGAREEDVHAFFTPAPATAFLRRALRRGDLVLLKGQANHHLSRVFLGLLGAVKCDTPSCARQYLCDRCPDLGLEWSPALAHLMAAPDSRA